MKFSKRRVIIIILALLFIGGFSFVTPKAFSYYQSNRFEQEGDKLLSQNEYQQALEKYQQSRDKWDDNKINEKITGTEELIESDNHYTAGVEAFDNEEYDKAIESLLLVTAHHKSYDQSKTLLKRAIEQRAKQKIAENTEPKQEITRVQGVNTQMTGLSVPNAQSPSPTLFLTNTPIPTQKPDDTSKLMAMKGLFEKIANLNKNLFKASFELNRLTSELNDCDSKEQERAKKYIEQGMPLSPESIRNNIESCRENIKSFMSPYIEMQNSSYEEISSINRQIQDIISTCGSSDCYDLYRGVVAGLEAEGLIVR